MTVRDLNTTVRGARYKSIKDDDPPMRKKVSGRGRVVMCEFCNVRVLNQPEALYRLLLELIPPAMMVIATSLYSEYFI